MATDILDRPTADGAPPELPPYLQRKRRKGRVVIIPSILHGELFSKTIDAAKEHWTLHYMWMVRVNTETGETEGPAHVNTRRYRAWLQTHETDTGVPPHIVFGGAVEAIPGGDPTFHDRWIAYARETFV